MPLCSVCTEQTPKYRCPACKIRYCSLICYKKHKDTCLPVPSPPAPTVSGSTTTISAVAFVSHSKVPVQFSGRTGQVGSADLSGQFEERKSQKCDPSVCCSVTAADPWTVDDLLHEDDIIDKVPMDRLQLLGQSKELQDLLCNPHLRQLLRSIDNAESKDQAMKAAMQEPLFVEFSDCCLKTVDQDDNFDDDDE